MRHLLSCLLLACAGASSAQSGAPAPMSVQDFDLDLMQGGPAWLVGDHVKARRHFRAAAARGDPLGQYNLAMMLLYREGGPCRPVEAKALLRRAADAGVELAREPLAQLQDPMTEHERSAHPFPCLRSPIQARRSTPAGQPSRLQTAN